MQTIKENNSKIKVTLPKKDVHRKMQVFYNPEMESNRNISVLLLNSIENKDMNIALPLAGSGIRAIRFLKEIDKINHIFVNDKSESFIKNFKSNLKLNQLNKNKLSMFNEEASLFLINQVNNKKKPKGFCGYFDYIELDPFGSPNPFLSASIARISRNGILAVTATDTAAFTGTYPSACKRKYWAKITKNYMMHELGLRILIRKVQLLGVQFDKALIPVLAYYKDHYYRVFFMSSNGKEKCDEIIKQHKYFLYNPKTLEFQVFNKCNERNNQFIGPLWVGKLQDKDLLKKMLKLNKFESEKKFLETLYHEKDLVGFHNLHVISKKYNLDTPKTENILKKVKGSRTHFSVYGIKTEKNVKEIVKVIK